MGNCNCFGLSLTSDSESKPNAIAPSFSSSGPSSSTTRGGGGSSSSTTGCSLPPIPNSDGEILETPRLRVFSFSELKAATKGFRIDTVLGEGGFGKVYKGWIDQDKLQQLGSSKMVVAIKKLNSESFQGFEQWQSEVNFLGTLAHQNLVTLLGYCWEDKELLLVYEYMARGSLENHLFRRSVEPLAWTKRISIALGAAHGLAFLHSLDTEVIYRDFKASNILLDGNYNAKLSDFGLAKFGPSGDESHVTTRVMGTYGYAAPEYVATGHLYVKSDVYGFGVVLLELLTGLRAIDPNRPNREQSLVNWKRASLSDKKKLKSLMDGRLNGQYPLKAAHEVAKLTAKCLREEPKMRPSMKEVVEVLQGVDAMNENRKDDIGSSPLKSSGGSSTPSSHRGSRKESGGWK